MTTAVLTPFKRGSAVRSGRLWKKLLLPIGTIDYEGRKVSFDRPYLEDLAGAYQAGAYDQVPFQLAGDENKHTNDVERFGGKVLGMDVDSEGLWVTVDPTERGEKVLEENPDLGVSARIVEDYSRTDGKFFPAAIQHVLGTLDPRVVGMGGWQKISLANEGVTQIFDLSGSSYEEDKSMPDFDAEQQAKLAKLLSIPESEIDKLLANLGSGGSGGGGSTATPPAQTGTLDLDSMSEEELVEMISGMSDEEFEEFAAAAGELEGMPDEEIAALLAGEGGSEEEPGPVPAGAALSGEAQVAIELANARAEENERALHAVTQHLDGERYERERRAYAEDLGIPPHIVDLAKPLLEGSGHVIDLSNGSSVDAGAVVRSLLNGFGKMIRMLDLSGEIGTSIDLSSPEEGAEDARMAERNDVIARYRAQAGI